MNTHLLDDDVRSSLDKLKRKHITKLCHLLFMRIQDTLFEELV